MTRFVRRATIAAAFIAAPMLTLAGPASAAVAAGATPSATVSVSYHAPHKKKHRPAKPVRPVTPTTPATTAPTTTPTTTAPATVPTTVPTTAPTVPTTKPTTVPTTPSTTPSTKPTSTPTTTAPAVTMTDFESQVFTLTNAQRLANGCQALRSDDRLVVAARKHSSDMVAQKFFSHTGSDGSDFVARELSAGYPKNGPSGENIAWGYRTPQEVVTGWMNSAGHRANILNCESIAIGVGVALAADGSPYWTQDFGRI